MLNDCHVMLWALQAEALALRLDAWMCITHVYILVHVNFISWVDLVCTVEF